MASGSSALVVPLSLCLLGVALDTPSATAAIEAFSGKNSTAQAARDPVRLASSSAAECVLIAGPAAAAWPRPGQLEVTPGITFGLPQGPSCPQKDDPGPGWGFGGGFYAYSTRPSSRIPLRFVARGCAVYESVRLETPSTL